MKLSYKAFHNNLSKVLMQHGASAADAHVTADVLLEGELRGYQNHGVERIFQILDGIEKKNTIACATPVIIKNKPSSAVIDGKFSLGYPVGKKAMELAIRKAKETGVGVVGVINCSHLGVLAYYAEIASKQNCIGIVMTTSSPAVVLRGGSVKTLGTNPLCYSIPHEPYPITADFSTSKVSRGTIYEHIEKDKSIPSSWAVDKEGKKTTCPKKALEGGLQVMDGDIKGGLLSLLLSILAGHMIGGVINPDVTGTRDMKDLPNKGDLFMAFHIPSFTEESDFSQKSHQLVDFILNQKIDFRIPGSRSRQNSEKNTKEGLLLSSKLQSLFEKYST